MLDKKQIRPSLGTFPVVESGIYDLIIGNGTMFNIMLWRQDDGIGLGVFGYGSYKFSHFAHYSYVNQKLNLGNVPDAKNLADFINTQLGLDMEQCSQGEYSDVKKAVTA